MHFNLSTLFLKIHWCLQERKESSIHLNFFLYLFMHVFDLLRALLLFLVAQSCLTLCDPMDYSPPGSSVYEISCHEARILEQVVIFFSRGSSWPRDQTCASCIAHWFFITEPPGKYPVLSSTVYNSQDTEAILMSNKRWMDKDTHTHWNTTLNSIQFSCSVMSDSLQPHEL